MALNANSNPAYIALQAFLGPANESHQTAIDFESTSTLTGAALSKATISVPATTTVSVSTATYFANCPSPQFFCAYDDTTSPGQNFGVSLAGSPYAMVAARSFWGYTCDGSALPATISLYNPNASASVITLACITN